jgi:hypothetical protein
VKPSDEWEARRDVWVFMVEWTFEFTGVEGIRKPGR